MTDYELAKTVLKAQLDYAGEELYDSDNIAGDPVETLFDNGRFHINLCADYGYFDVVGLSSDDFAHLKMWWNVVSNFVDSLSTVDESDDEDDDVCISEEQFAKFDEEADRSFLNWKREKALTERAESRGLDGMSLDEIQFKKNEEDYVNRTIKSNPFYCILAKHARESGFELRVVRISDL